MRSFSMTPGELNHLPLEQEQEFIEQLIANVRSNSGEEMNK